MDDSESDLERPIHVAGEERTHPALHQLARAMLALGRQQLEEEKFVEELLALDPNITQGNYGNSHNAFYWKNEPFCFILQGQLVYRIDPKRSDHRPDRSELWPPIRKPDETREWVVLSSLTPTSTWMRYVKLALSQLGK